MAQNKKTAVMIGFAILVFAAVALTGRILSDKGGNARQAAGEDSGLRCIYDGALIKPLYQVVAYQENGEPANFCSIYCATRWRETNKDNVRYFTVGDEVTGERFDATLVHFVESDFVTVPEVKNHVHAFYLKTDAQTHARQFNGKMIDNPFGGAFNLPAGARFDKLTIAVPAFPDSLPLRLGIYRPVFKENRLAVTLVTYTSDPAGEALVKSGKVDGIVCSLPAGLMLAAGTPSVRIVKNVLRANPFRPLFALVAASGLSDKGFLEKETVRIALPDGVSARFYADHYLSMLSRPADKVVMQPVKDYPSAWDLLKRSEVDAALLRTPYTNLARQEELIYLADDRNLPWMSVLVLKSSLINEKFETVKRFLFALEQSVLALNLKQDEFRELIDEQTGVPKKAQAMFPMPIFEGANAPAPDEIKAMVKWLRGAGLISKKISYKQLVNPDFLPNSEDVGLAFCCR